MKLQTLKALSPSWTAWLVLLGILILTVARGSANVESLKLARIYEGYALSWVESSPPLLHWLGWPRALQVKYFKSLPDALDFQKKNFKEFSGQPSFALKPLEQEFVVKSEWQRYVLQWYPDPSREMRLSFKTREEAEFFRTHFRHGRYTRSPFGHAILFTR